MTYEIKQEIYKAQTANVRHLETVWTHLNRLINQAYAKNDRILIEIFTQQLIQIYCAYTEANFSKLIHTPHGLELNEIAQIKNIIKQKNVTEGWKKAIELSVKKIKSNGNHKPNLIKKLNNLIDTYISDPSQLRNKIAHGQWKIALNGKDTNINNELTEKLKDFNSMDISIKKISVQKVIKIIEDIIESPNKAHFTNYFTVITNYEEELKKMKNWDINDKKNLLRKKYLEGKKKFKN